MSIKLISALLLAIGITVAGPNVSSPIIVDMDPAQTGIQSTVDLRDTGTSFSVAIVAQNVTDLMGCEITLKIDTTKYKLVSNAYGSAFNNSMSNIWAADSSWVKFTYARMGMTPQYLTAPEVQLGTVALKNKVGPGGSAQIQVLSGKFGAAGPEYDDFVAITGGTYNVLQPQCLVSILTAPGGTINTTSISANVNAPSAPIIATPDGCHTFKLWELVSGSATINSPTMATTTVTPTTSCQIRATYTAIQYTLTVNCDGNGTATGTGTYDCGIQPTVQSTPNAGYGFLNWTVVSGNASFTNARSMSTSVIISGNAVIQANFAHGPCILSTDNDGDGTVDSIRSVQYGASGSITASTIPGKTFANWTVTGSGTIQTATSATTTVTLTGDATFTAHFTVTQYPLNLIAVEGGTVSPSSPQSVSHGDSIQVTAQPNPGYAFINWTVTVGDIFATLRTPTAPTTWAVITGPATIQANFIAVVAVHNCVPKTPLAFDLSVSDATVQYTIPAGKQGGIKVKIMEMNGKLITEHVATADVAGYFRFDLKNLRKGCYICSMKAGNFSKMVKVIRVK